MDYNKLFKFLVVDDEVGQDSTGGKLIDAIINSIRARGYTAHTATNGADAKLAIQNDATIACFLVDWDMSDESTLEIIDYIRERGLEAPIFVVTEKHKVDDISEKVLDKVRGYVYPQEDTPDFIAKYVARGYSEYIEDLKTPFFGGMIDYVEAGNEMWLAPGHNGGMFYLKSPIGRILFEYLGETFWRADFNFVPDLGGIFDHTGAYLKAEQDAAKIFNAERTYFVLNGTSTSNKMVNGALVAKDDLVLFDRNNHKSNHQSALMLAGGIPIYLPDDRNHYGMVGPVDYTMLDEDKLREQIKNNPLVKDPNAWKKERPFRLAIIENCTYDGTIYDVQEVVNKIGHLCDYMFFDEAWGGFMRFHPLYAGRYAMGLENLNDESPGLFVTQSTHKQLAGMSQASQIHVKDKHIKGQKRRINHKRFNEVYMMHMSTSPYYPMFASLDVGAQMMKGKNGTFLWNEALETAIDIRKKIRHIAREHRGNEKDKTKQWFFDPFVPDKVGLKHWEDIDTDKLASDQKYWIMQEGQHWHGYTKIKGDYIMVDPSKMLLLTPGIDRKTGKYEDWGVPAPILGEYMRSKGIVPEKNDFNHSLFLITPGIEKSKAGTLLTELMAFKHAVDDGALMDDVLPKTVAAHPDYYRGKKLRDLCWEYHNVLKEYDGAELQRQIFQMDHFPEMAMTPHDAHNALVANNVDYLPLDQCKGRIAATLALVYPPGIGVVMPGERWDKKAQPQLDYFHLFEVIEEKFPGFENEIQGCYPERMDDGGIKYHTYVVKE